MALTLPEFLLQTAKRQWKNHPEETSLNGQAEKVGAKGRLGKPAVPRNICIVLVANAISRVTQIKERAGKLSSCRGRGGEGKGMRKNEPRVGSYFRFSSYILFYLKLTK